MNATIRNINPNGSQYIYYFSDDVLSDMPDNLKNKLKSYDALYNEIQKTRKMALDSTKVTNYNNVVTSITKKFANVSDDDKDKVTFNKLTNPLVGYSSLIAARYDATDLYYYINDSMMPVIDINGLGVQDSLTSIKNGIKALGGVAVTKVSSIESSVVRNTLEKLCQVFCSTAYYDISVETKSLSAYNSSTKTKTYSCNLQTAIGSTGLGLMTEKERSKLDSIKVSSGGTIDFSGVTASGALAATVGDDKTVAITHNVSGVKAGTYKSVTVDTYGHVTAGTNPTTLSGYGITDALNSSTKYALSDSVGGNALKANLLAKQWKLRIRLILPLKKHRYTLILEKLQLENSYLQRHVLSY